MNTTRIIKQDIATEDKSYYISLLHKLCKNYGIDFSIMAAICEHESSWDPYAIRYEENYKFLENPQKYTHVNNNLATEKILQSMSFGIGQIMAATARNLGFKDSLIKLAEPEIGLEYACKYFKRNCERYPSIDRKIAAYNAGSAVYDNGVLKNQKYVDAVLPKIKIYQT